MIAWLSAVFSFAPAQQWFHRRAFRATVGRQIHDACITLNLALIRLLQDAWLESEVQPGYFRRPSELNAIDEYFEIDRAGMAGLPELQSLEHWNRELGGLYRMAEHPLAFRMIEMLGSLTIDPMKRCVSRETRGFVERILARPEVVKYRTDYYSAWAKRLCR